MKALMKALMNAVEKGDVVKVNSLIESNHKYLGITPIEKKNETNILKKIKIIKFFGDVNAPLRALYYLTITTFYGCNG